MSSTSILVSLDGSARAEAILPHALTLAHLTTSELILLRVITPPEQYTDPPTLLPENWYDDERAWSQDYLTTTAQRLKGSVPVRIEILDGDAGGNIISYARTHADVYLVALATRGRGTLGRWILGSVAEQVMHATTSPLLLLHPSEQVGLEAQPISAHLYRRMIVPLDGTALDERALDYVKTLAFSSQAEVTLISISPLPDEDDLDDTQHIPHVEEAQRQARRATYLAQRAQQLRATAGLTVETELATGDSEAWVERLTQNQQEVLIITPYRHHSDRLALRFLHHTNIPVLLIMQ